ncbi:MAG: M20/M25/M40 family metallo-hydrolase, partial [Rikenellaceae bacterium]|nr:M20/M25/M40 family metallo-hydrolase [Rikenellaceae bacterium]
MKISELTPAPLWSFFEQITRIPRPSGHEQEITRWLALFAQERGLEHRFDKAGNLLIVKRAQNSSVTTPIALQSHVDMVCEKDSGVETDFEHDPIPAYVDGGYVLAKGTSLGADCGIGMAVALYVLDSATMSHPPIEALFTVDEERGLTGASGLGKEMLTAPRLINLDSEDEEQ